MHGEAGPEVTSRSMEEPRPLLAGMSGTTPRPTAVYNATTTLQGARTNDDSIGRVISGPSSVVRGMSLTMLDGTGTHTSQRSVLRGFVAPTPVVPANRVVIHNHRESRGGRARSLVVDRVWSRIVPFAATWCYWRVWGRGARHIYNSVVPLD